MSRLTETDFINTFQYYKAEEWQRSGVKLLYDALPDALKSDYHAWIRTYRGGLKPTKPDINQTDNVLIDVPFQSQNDNVSGTGYRECFSSSMAMIAMHYGKIQNDDAYNEVRARYGDSTDAHAQVQALLALGLDATFITNATTEDLKSALREGRPCGVGWLHKGSSDAPQGTGHWSVICGFSDKDQCWTVNDPNGEILLSSGTYSDNLNGYQLQYSYKNFNPRWIVEGEGSGWMMDVRDPLAKK